MPDERSNYAQGVADGVIEQRLAGHDKHFEAINGSLTRIATEMAALTLAVQRLADQAISRDATVKTTAEALEKARVTQKDVADQRWSPWQKGLAVLGGIVALTVIYYFIKGR